MANPQLSIAHQHTHHRWGEGREGRGALGVGVRTARKWCVPSGCHGVAASCRWHAAVSRAPEGCVGPRPPQWSRFCQSHLLPRLTNPNKATRAYTIYTVSYKLCLSSINRLTAEKILKQVTGTVRLRVVEDRSPIVPVYSKLHANNTFHFGISARRSKRVQSFDHSPASDSMQEAGAGVSTVTTPGERHRSPNRAQHHRIAHIGHMRSPPAATCHLQCPPCCRLILAFECSRARSIIDHFKAFPQAPPRLFRSTTRWGSPDAAAGCGWSTD